MPNGNYFYFTKLIHLLLTNITQTKNESLELQTYATLRYFSFSVTNKKHKQFFPRKIRANSTNQSQKLQRDIASNDYEVPLKYTEEKQMISEKLILCFILFNTSHTSTFYFQEHFYHIAKSQFHKKCSQSEKKTILLRLQCIVIKFISFTQFNE